MLTKGVVPYLRGAGQLFVFVLTVVSTAPLTYAASTYGVSDNSAHQNVGVNVDQFLALTLSDYGSEPVDRAIAVDDAISPGVVKLLAYRPGDDEDQPDEFSNVVRRHNGFRKFLLLVFVCGAVIRFFTSKTFLTFIKDALDPKAW